MPSEFAIRDSVEPELHLQIHNVLDSRVFMFGQLLLRSLAIIVVCTCFEEILGTFQRAQMLCSKWRIAIKFGCHVVGRFLWMEGFQKWGRRLQ